MADDQKREVSFKKSIEFKENYIEHLKKNPDIAKRFAEFVAAKKKRPPDRMPSDHRLKGRLSEYSECHLAGDSCLVYRDKDNIVHLLIICSHDDLCGPRERSMAKRLSMM